MAIPDVNTRLRQAEAALTEIRLRANSLVDDARLGIDAALESNIWDVSAQVDTLHGNVQAYLEDAFIGRHTTLDSIAQDAQLIIDAVWGVLGSQFTLLIGAIEDYVYASLDAANRELQGLVGEVADSLDLVLTSANTMIDQAGQQVQDESEGLLDTVANTITGLFSGTLSMAEALTGVAGDIVNPLILGLSEISSTIVGSLEGLLTFDPETWVGMQKQITDAQIKMAGGS